MEENKQNVFSSLWSKLTSLVKNFIAHWNKPGDGRYVSNKEVLAYSIGGMGVQFVAVVVGQIALSTNCLLLASIYGMTPTELTLLLTVNTIVTLVMQPLKSYWIDNVGAKENKGKARPFILWLGLPSAILCTMIAFIRPTWPKSTVVALVGVVFIVMNFIYQFYYGMYIQLSQLMSPNTTERADIISVSSIIYSFAPTLTGFFFPLISKAFPLGQLDQRFYQVIFPVFGLFGVVLSLCAYFGTKERIVVPKRYKAKVKFSEGFKAIVKNRYFWILNVSGWFAFARAGLTGLMTWGYIYVLQNEVVQSFVTLIMGTASLFGMALAPLMCRFLGKKNTVIVTNAVFAVVAGLYMITPTNFIMLSIYMYLAYWSVAVQIITAPAMNADALDYQQWKTGDRLEGFAGNFAIIGAIIALATNYVIPLINEYFGLLDNYDFLYDPSLSAPMYRILALVSCIGSVLYLLPFLFWNLSEKTHAKIIEELKERAKLQNEEDGFKDASLLSSNELLEAELTDEERAALHSKFGENYDEEMIKAALKDEIVDDYGDETLKGTHGQFTQYVETVSDARAAQIANENDERTADTAETSDLNGEVRGGEDVEEEK